MPSPNVGRAAPQKSPDKKKKNIDKRTISPPIPPQSPPRVMLEAAWPARMIDGIDETFPVDFLYPGRRMSLFQHMQRARAFRSEMTVPRLDPGAQARLKIAVPLHDPRRGSPLRPALVRGVSLPVRLPSTPEHQPLASLQPLGGGHEHPAPVFSDPFAPIAQGPGGKQGVAVEPEVPHGGKAQIGVAGAIEHVTQPSLGGRRPTHYPAPDEI